ncbi:MAG: SRPBCC domain-containing protein [Myxococcaceae bacterium]|nr:SRPBCC domain-containing protein [Myxococcaceae bacterium]
MKSPDPYTPGPASGAEVHKSDEATWTLVMVRDLKHPPERVWAALTDRAQLKEWAPFDSDQNLGTAGTRAKLTTAGAPQAPVSETTVKRAEPPKLLEFNWGDWNVRWELEPQGANGTRLTLWTNINRHYIAMGAAGWHVCFDVLERLLGGQPVGRIVGPQAMEFSGWHRLHAEYARLFGVQTPGFPTSRADP